MTPRIIVHTGANISLLLPDMEDLPMIMAGVHNPEMSILLGAHSPKLVHSLAQKEWFEGKLKKDSLYYIIQENQTGENIGTIEIMNFDPWDRRGELSMAILVAEKQGLGYGVETLTDFLRIIFGYYGMNKVTLRVTQKNIRATHLYKKVGFQECGRFRQDRYVGGSWEDTIHMELLRDDWVLRNPTL